MHIFNDMLLQMKQMVNIIKYIYLRITINLLLKHTVCGRCVIIRLSLFLLPQHFLYVCERCINFLHHFELLPSLSQIMCQRYTQICLYFVYQIIMSSAVNSLV